MNSPNPLKIKINIITSVLSWFFLYLFVVLKHDEQHAQILYFQNQLQGIQLQFGLLKVVPPPPPPNPPAARQDARGPERCLCPERPVSVVLSGALRGSVSAVRSYGVCRAAGGPDGSGNDSGSGRGQESGRRVHRHQLPLRSVQRLCLCMNCSHACYLPSLFRYNVVETLKI